MLLLLGDDNRQPEYLGRLRTAKRKLAKHDAQARDRRNAKLYHSAWKGAGRPIKEHAARLKPKTRATPIAEIIDKDQIHHTSPEELRHTLEGSWVPRYQRKAPPTEGPAAQAKERVLQSIRDDSTRQVPQDLKKHLDIDAICHVQNITEAITALGKHKTPGASGIPVDFYHALQGSLAQHLSRVFRVILERGTMTKRMQQATISLVYKHKGKRTSEGAYRPLAVTDSVYRILARSIAQRLAHAASHIIGDDQVGFLLQRRLEENTINMYETMRQRDSDHPEKGGLICCLDNFKAFDLAQWEFLQEVLQAFSFPPELCNAVATLYSGSKITFKLNGEIGEAYTISAGVKQGCPCSAILYVIIQEVFLRMLRTEDGLTQAGIPIPNAAGKMDDHTRLRTLALADDTAVALACAAHLPALIRTVRKFEEISGHQINIDKTIAILFGHQKAHLDPDGKPDQALVDSGTALLVAVQQARHRPKGTLQHVHSDSQYAIGRAVTSGSSRKNKAIVQQLRKALHACRAHHGYRNVIISQVKAHSDHPRNDLADKLAKAGAAATTMQHTMHVHTTRTHTHGINSTPLGAPQKPRTPPRPPHAGANPHGAAEHSTA